MLWLDCNLQCCHFLKRFKIINSSRNIFHLSFVFYVFLVCLVSSLCLSDSSISRTNICRLQIQLMSSYGTTSCTTLLCWRPPSRGSRRSWTPGPPDDSSSQGKSSSTIDLCSGVPMIYKCILIYISTKDLEKSIKS